MYRQRVTWVLMVFKLSVLVIYLPTHSSIYPLNKHILSVYSGSGPVEGIGNITNASDIFLTSWMILHSNRVDSE